MACHRLLRHLSARVEQISNHVVDNKNHACHGLRKKLQIRKGGKAENEACGAGSDLELTIKLLEIKKKYVQRQSQT